MNKPINHLFILLFVVGCRTSQADPLDVSINQSIENTTETQQQQLAKSEALTYAHPSEYKYYSFLSKPSALLAPTAPPPPPNSVFADYSFKDKHSEIGGGSTVTNGCDAGLDFQTPIGLEVNPFFSFGDARTDLPHGTAVGDSYGGTLSLTQTIRSAPTVADLGKPNIIPLGFSIGAAFTYTSLNLKTPSATSTVASGSDAYDAIPLIHLIYEQNERLSWFLTPSFDYNDTSKSGSGEFSSGLLNTELRCVGSVSPVLSLYGRAVWLHQTNAEPPSGSATASYYNWAKFGVGAIYSPTRTIKFTIDYSYEALNPTYEAHNFTIKAAYFF